jgi:hypothetical protein
MDHVERMATDIGLVLQNEYHTQKQIEDMASKLGFSHLSNEIAVMYYTRIHACLNVIEDAARTHLLDCSINHAVVLNDGLMLIREICLNLGYSVFDTIAEDYYEVVPPTSTCLDCEKMIPTCLSLCIECQTAANVDLVDTIV